MKYPSPAEMARKLRQTAFRARDREVARHLLDDARHLEQQEPNGDCPQDGAS